MDEKRKLWILVILAVVTVLLILFFVFKDSLFFSPTANPENCKVLEKNSEKGVNLVFLSDNKTAREYSDFLKTVSPFKENIDSFNFYYIDSYTPACTLYKGIALLCYNKEIIQKASACPNDIIIIPQEKENNIRSSSYMNVLSINSAQEKTVLIHEMGHALANLADEYVPAEIPKKSKNCQKTCESFSVKEGCFLGCSKDSYYRSIDFGVMRTLATSKFGELNQNIILEKITSKSTSAITGNVISEQVETCSQEYILIQGNYNSGTLEIASQSLETGCIPEVSSGDFEYELSLEDNSTLSGEEFNPAFIFTDIQGENTLEGSVELSQENFYLMVPAIPHSEKLSIKENGNLIQTVDLTNSIQKLNSIPCKDE